jgi:Saxitoxin biosynthesis operon protein SxtJ
MATTPNSFPELDRKGYREFGLTTGAIVAGLFGLVFPFILDASYPVWPWVIFAVLTGMALAFPMGLAPVYKYWMKFGHFMGTYIMTPLIMLIVFFGMFMPIGILMRLSGKDAMARKLDSNTNSYRVPSDSRPVKNLEKPF